MSVPAPDLVMIVAETEADSDALHAALAPLGGGGRVRLVGGVTPDRVEQGLRTFRPTLICAPAGIFVPDTALPIVRVPAGTDPAQALLAYLDSRQAPATQPVQPAQKPAPSAALPPRPALQVRLGFWGARGGVGVTTAVIEAGRLLVERGLTVALCDATQRGDIALRMGLEPAPDALKFPGGTIFEGIPAADRLTAFGAVVVDGGRAQRAFNANWIQLTEPMKPEELQRQIARQWPDHP